MKLRAKGGVAGSLVVDGDDFLVQPKITKEIHNEIRRALIDDGLSPAKDISKWVTNALEDMFENENAVVGVEDGVPIFESTYTEQVIEAAYMKEGLARAFRLPVGLREKMVLAASYANIAAVHQLPPAYIFCGYSDVVRAAIIRKLAIRANIPDPENS